MAEHVIIDGNNLLYSVHEHAPGPYVGRETLVRIVDQWARRSSVHATIVFDGPVPRSGLAQQMQSGGVAVRFSGSATADDVIVAMIEQVGRPDSVRVVTGDTAIRREARYGRCRHTESAAFVRELFPPRDVAGGTSEEPTGRGEPEPAGCEKPDVASPDQTEAWLREFGYDLGGAEPFEGYLAMRFDEEAAEALDGLEADSEDGTSDAGHRRRP